MFAKWSRGVLIAQSEIIIRRLTLYPYKVQVAYTLYSSPFFFLAIYCCSCLSHTKRAQKDIIKLPQPTVIKLWIYWSCLLTEALWYILPFWVAEFWWHHLTSQRVQTANRPHHLLRPALLISNSPACRPNLQNRRLVQEMVGISSRIVSIPVLFNFRSTSL